MKDVKVNKVALAIEIGEFSSRTSDESDLGQFIRWYAEITDQKLAGISVRMNRHFTGFFRSMSAGKASPGFCMELYELLEMDLGKDATQITRVEGLARMSRISAGSGGSSWKKIARKIRKLLLEK